MLEIKEDGIRSLEIETRLVNYLANSNLLSVIIHSINGNIKWKKHGDRIFYEFLFKNFI